MLRSKKPITLVIFLILFVTVVPSQVWAEQTDAATAISSAKNMILSCYGTIKETETSGANITILTATLNEASSLLSQAELAYATNDFETAVNLAFQSQNRLSNFTEEANTLRETAVQQLNQDFLINVVGSIVGTFVIILAGFAVWRFLKKKSETTEAHTSESPRV